MLLNSQNWRLTAREGGITVYFVIYLNVIGGRLFRFEKWLFGWHCSDLNISKGFRLLLGLTAVVVVLYRVFSFACSVGYSSAQWFRGCAIQRPLY